MRFSTYSSRDQINSTEFIGYAKSLHGNQDHQDKLMSNFFAQTEALLNGKTSDQVKLELTQKDYQI